GDRVARGGGELHGDLDELVHAKEREAHGLPGLRAGESLLQVGAEAVDGDDLVTRGESGGVRRRPVRDGDRLQDAALLAQRRAEPRPVAGVRLWRIVRILLGASLVVGTGGGREDRLEPDARERLLELQLLRRVDRALEPLVHRAIRDQLDRDLLHPVLGKAGRAAVLLEQRAHQVVERLRPSAAAPQLEVGPSIPPSRRVWSSRVQSYGVNADGRTRFTFQRWKNSCATNSRKSS